MKEKIKKISIIDKFNNFLMGVKEKYDKKGNLIYRAGGHNKSWYKYDDKNKLIYSKEIYYAYNGVFEKWYKYNKKGYLISDITYGKKVDDKSFVKTETWYKNNEKGLAIYSKDSNGLEFWYDKDGDIRYSRNSKGVWRDKETNIISKPDDK